MHELAVDACDKALGSIPLHAEALEMKADSLGRLKRPEDSLAAAEQALELEPGRAHAYYLKANALGKLGRKEECLACLRPLPGARPQEGQRLLQQGVSSSST